jgi:outer membrane murein-binding lipoprotein Lpp
MHGRIIGPVLGSMAVAAVVAASFSVSGGLSTNGKSDTPSTNSAANAATVEAEPFCPSADEVREHWEAHGEEPKPDAECADLEPSADQQAAARKEANRAAHEQSRGSHDHHSHEHAQPTLITSMRQAQAVLDPENDPLVLVDRDAQGRYLAIHMVLAPGQASPPAYIRTADQFAKWLDAGSKARAQGSKR